MWKRLIAGLLAGALLISGCMVPKKEEKKKNPETLAAEENVQAAFDEFLDRLFVEELEDNIINLHYTVASPKNYGITEYKLSLGDFEEETYRESEKESEETLKELKEFEYDSLSDEQKNIYDLLLETLEYNADYSDFFYYEEPLAPTSGIQSQLPILLAEYTLRTEQDVEDYLGTLAAVGDYFKSLLNFEKKKAEAGLFMSDDNLDNILSQCKSFCEKEDGHLLMVTFEERLEGLEASEEKKTAWVERNQELVKTVVIPAYKSLAEGLEGLRGSGKNTGGLCNLEKGKEYYEYLVRYYTGSDRSIEDMLKLIKASMDKDMKEMMNVLTENPELYSQLEKTAVPQTKPEDILGDLQEKIKKNFPEAATSNYQVKKVDESLEELSSPAFYLTPPIDDIENNVIYINGANGYEGLQLYTTLAHEGYPGHLYQETYFKNTNPNPIRSVFSYGGYTEGWGLYAEAYGYQMADMDKNLAALQRCNFTTSMAMYANMDIGIHYEGWSQEDTAAYLAGYGIADASVVKEVYDYIVAEPSNYLKYFMGYLEIQELKKYCKKLMGKKYSDLEFHTFFLSQGPSSFSVLKKRCEEAFGTENR